MKKVYLFFILLTLISACGQPAPEIAVEIPSTPESQVLETNVQAIEKISLKRGMNLGNMLEGVFEGELGLVVEEEYLDIIKEAGFDFIRLPVKWSTHADVNEPYSIDPVFLARVDEVINWALARDLAVVMDVHHYDEMSTNPWEEKTRFAAIWRQLAEHYKDYPPTLIFELLNEPNDQLDAPLWNSCIHELVSIIRETNPTRDIVIGPVYWNIASWISTLDLPEDENLIVTFHYYDPYEFTHQGAEWIDGAVDWLGYEWGTEADKIETTSTFNQVAEWAERKNVRILLGEFGVYSAAYFDQRVQWTTFIREQAEIHGFAWAYWEFGSGFGAYDLEANQWREPMLQALIP